MTLILTANVVKEVKKYYFTPQSTICLLTSYPYVTLNYFPNGQPFKGVDKPVLQEGFVSAGLYVLQCILLRSQMTALLFCSNWKNDQNILNMKA